MSSELYRVKDLAALSGVTVRTLHHYHRIGLLVPSTRSAAGYRLYDEGDLVRLQQILIWRALGFPLAEIHRLLDDPDYDRARALRRQREALAARAASLLAMARSADRTLDALEGGAAMDTKRLFEGFDPARYEAEVEENWGDTEAYRESKRRTSRYSERDWARITREAGRIYGGLARHLRDGLPPDAPEVQELAEQHRQHIDRWFYPCSQGAHRALADLYTADPRFKASLDEHGDGVAQFLADAIRTG